MIIDEFIAASVPQVQPGQTGNEVLALMDDSQLTQLPVVAGEQYLALLREQDLMDWTSPQLAVSQSGLLAFKPAILSHSHPLQAWRLAVQHELDVIPIVSKEGQYTGAVTRQALMEYVSENTGYRQPGGVLVLAMKRSHYSLSELAQIAESEDVSITSVGMTEPNENGEVEVALKTNSTDLSALIASLERHDYHVLHIFGAEHSQDDLMSRYQLLMNYINM